MTIPNAPDELDLEPLIEYLSKVYEGLTGVPRERYRRMYEEHFYWFFLEERDTYEQKQVDELVEMLRYCWNKDLP
jgi:hypothetical protein